MKLRVVTLAKNLRREVDSFLQQQVLVPDNAASSGRLLRKEAVRKLKGALHESAQELINLESSSGLGSSTKDSVSELRYSIDEYRVVLVRMNFTRELSRSELRHLVHASLAFKSRLSFLLHGIELLGKTQEEAPATATAIARAS